MNENLNLVEILKDCPKGTKLYTPISGEVYLNRVYCNNDDYPINVSCDISGNGIELSFAKDGRYYSECEDGECILFPSRDQRDWIKFKPKEPKFDTKTLQEYNKVLVRDENGQKWMCDIFSYYDDKNPRYPFWGVGRSNSKQCIPYKGNEHLLGITNDCDEFYKNWQE